MSDWFLGEIRVFPYGYAPNYWLDCDGRLLKINQYQALYSLLGNTYGGSQAAGTFALPDLRGRVALHPNNIADSTRVTLRPGNLIGEENHILTTDEVPSHTHVPRGNNTAGTKNTLAGNVWAAGAAGQSLYGAFPAAPVAMNTASVQPAGDRQSHLNMQPFQVLRYCIAVMGIYPPRP